MVARMTRSIVAIFAVLFGLVAPLTTRAVAESVDCTERILVGVAHSDDDLLFINPEIKQALDAGSCVHVVYLTAGDAGLDLAYVESRERGIQAAYSLMLNSAGGQRDDIEVVGNTLRSVTIPNAAGHEQARLTFLRLPDGMPKGQGTPVYGNESLLRLFRAEIPAVTAVDDTATYTESDLLDALADVTRRFRPDRVLTLDHDITALNWSVTRQVDHADHAVTGRYFRTTQYLAAPFADFRSYVGYGVATRPENIDPAEAEVKAAVFAEYLRHEGCEPADCPPPGPVPPSYAPFIAKNYEIPRYQPSTGQVMSAIGNRSPDLPQPGHCLTAVDGLPKVAPCDTADVSQWLLTDGELRHVATGHCLQVNGSELAMGVCEVPRSTRWHLTHAGQLRSRDGCLSQDDALRTNPGLRMAACQRVPEQQWQVVGDQ